jgi:hypothetical protein
VTQPFAGGRDSEFHPGGDMTLSPEAQSKAITQGKQLALLTPTDRKAMLSTLTLEEKRAALAQMPQAERQALLASMTPAERDAIVGQGSAKPAPAKDACYTVTFHHKHPGARDGDEVCSHHKNLIRIKAAEGLKLNPKTVCIRVNGTPVKFTPVKGKSNEFVIGAVMGVQTAITARYCTGPFKCSEDCRVPRDDFAEAIGGTDMDSEEKHHLEVAVWDKEDAADKAANQKLQGEMHKELKDLDEVSKAAAEGYSLFQDWIAEGETPACLTRQASGDENRKVAATRGDE